MAKTRSRSRLWAAVPLLVLVFAGWQTVTILSREPAFNRSLQVEAAGGGRVPPSVSANFDRASYYYLIALEWQSRTAAEMSRGLETTPVPIETVLERNRLIRNVATKALRYNPAHARNWMLLANAKAALGEDQGALLAWQASFDLAPHDAPLSYDRLIFLIRFMTEPEAHELAVSRIAPQSVQSDLETLKTSYVFKAIADAYFEAPAIEAFIGNGSR